MRKVNMSKIPRFVLPAILLLLLSCPAPLTEIMLSNVKDSVFPIIEITSPVADSYCANLVEVSGRATDLSDNERAGEISRIDYLIAGTALNGEITLAENGSFSFIFSTVSLGTNFTLVLTAVDWNGNSISEYVALRKNPESSIPSFFITPGNKTVQFNWDPVPKTESYTIYYTTNGSLPSEIMGDKIENITSPYELSSLENGIMLIAMLKANPESGYSESLSDYEQVIPMSEFTLDVRTLAEFKQIRVEWENIPAIETYEIFRSSERDGTYYNLSGPISRNYYIDTEVENDSWYYYKVKPSLDGGTFSNYAAGQSSPFSTVFPLHVATLSTPDWAEYVDVQGDYAYVAIKSSGFLVVDVSDPSTPWIAGSEDTPGTALAVTVFGDYAYVADWSSGVQVIDVSDPAKPTIVNSCPTNSSYGITQSGDYLFVACGSELAILDIAASPSNPPIVKTITVPGYDVVVLDNYVYLASNGGLQIVNIAPDITDSAVVNTVNVSTGSCIAVKGNYAYLGYSSYPPVVNIVDITSKTVPTTAGMVTIPLDDSCRDVEIRGNYLYVGDNQAGGLKVYDISDPAAPHSVGSYDTTGATANLAIGGDYLFVADYEGGLQILNVANPATPGNEGFLTFSGACGVDIQGDYAFLSTWDWEMVVGRISDPDSPSYVTSAVTSTDTFNIDVRGRYAFVAEENINGLSIFDILNPESPVRLSELSESLSGDISDVFVAGDYAYLSAYGFGLYIVDISDPGEPVLVGSCYSINGQGVVAQGDYAYLAASYQGMRIIDISNPSAPFIANTCATNDETFSIALQGNYAYVADYDGGISVADISDPLASGMVFLDTLDPVSPNIRAYDIAISGNWAFIADSRSGLQVVDISDPANLSLIGSLDINYGGEQVRVSGYRAYVVDTGGMQIVNLYSE